jgi:hypothetical protein
MDANLKRTRRQIRREKTGMITFANVASFAIVNTLAAPFSVLGTALQLSIVPNLVVYGPPTKAIALLEMAKSKELAVREMRYNALQLASGMVGENRPFRCPTYKNYREAFMGLAG